MLRSRRQEASSPPAAPGTAGRARTTRCRGGRQQPLRVPRSGAPTIERRLTTRRPPGFDSSRAWRRRTLRCRTCWPARSPPASRTSTRLDFVFVAASVPASASRLRATPLDDLLLTRLRLWGFPRPRLDSEDRRWQPPVRPGDLLPARVAPGGAGSTAIWGCHDRCQGGQSPRRVVDLRPGADDLLRRLPPETPKARPSGAAPFRARTPSRTRVGTIATKE